MLIVVRLPLILISGLIAVMAGCQYLPVSQAEHRGRVSSVSTEDSYTNPVIHADYSDPDVIRVGSRYYMTASSFNNAPGLPLLQSDDMVSWELVGHALPGLLPGDIFATPQHGKGVWAPCLRYHDNQFWIFYPDPDAGIYVMTAHHFSGPWTKPSLLLAGKGLIDPAPLWDDDGHAYLLHAWAKSRAGFNNVLTLRRMSWDASRITDDGGKLVIDGNALPHYKTLEGPKFYRRNGYYYVFAPAGGVEDGWQSVFRATHVDGPYEDKIVMQQGTSSVNGPHQGAWVHNQDGTDWFYHFQDKRAYGRVVHLQPMIWKDDWPVIGQDLANTGIGEPVASYARPLAAQAKTTVPIPTTDEFSEPHLGLQWQWNANSRAEWFSLAARPGHLRLYTQFFDTDAGQPNLWNSPSLLLQKLPAENFVVDVKLDPHRLPNGGSSGVLMLGLNYAWLGVTRRHGRNEIVLVSCDKADQLGREKINESHAADDAPIYLRMAVTTGGMVQFSYSLDQQTFILIGTPFKATMGRWVGAQMGLFSVVQVSLVSTSNSPEHFADIDYFRVQVK
ncbi:glycoside hydrolase 43 family protein [Undibacterium sp. Xuan67W]|uniref:glycoside hydrolase family 43 protein n=1 Tax=Undibacterium sp. Xuan67W TaxID=3413057 RepID=UPI003BF39376